MKKKVSVNNNDCVMQCRKVSSFFQHIMTHANLSTVFSTKVPTKLSVSLSFPLFNDQLALFEDFSCFLNGLPNTIDIKSLQKEYK